MHVYRPNAAILSVYLCECFRTHSIRSYFAIRIFSAYIPKKFFDLFADCEMFLLYSQLYEKYFLRRYGQSKCHKIETMNIFIISSE